MGRLAEPVHQVAPEVEGDHDNASGFRQPREVRNGATGESPSLPEHPCYVLYVPPVLIRVHGRQKRQSRFDLGRLK